MRTRTPFGITSVRGFECTAHSPAVGRNCESTCCPKTLTVGGVSFAAPVPTVMPRAMSALGRFRDVGCPRRRNRPPMRASDRAGWTSTRRRDHPRRARKGAWQSWRNGGLGRLRHRVWSRWIEGRRWLWRWGFGKLRLCRFDCQAEEGHPSGHENPRQRHPLKSRRLHRGLLRADVSAQPVWIDNTTIDAAVPAGSSRRPSPSPAGGGSTAQRVRPDGRLRRAGWGGRRCRYAERPSTLSPHPPRFARIADASHRRS
jgi:hypothetical protein